MKFQKGDKVAVLDDVFKRCRGECSGRFDNYC